MKMKIILLINILLACSSFVLKQPPADAVVVNVPEIKLWIDHSQQKVMGILADTAQAYVLDYSSLSGTENIKPSIRANVNNDIVFLYAKDAKMDSLTIQYQQIMDVLGFLFLNDIQLEITPKEVREFKPKKIISVPK